MIANEILHISRNANDAILRAEEVSIDIEENWEKEETKFSFEDGSILLISGPQVNVIED